MTEIIKKQVGENPPIMKVIWFGIKAACGVVGSAMVIEQSHPYVAVSVLAIGAVADQVINLYQWKNKNPK